MGKRDANNVGLPVDQYRKQIGKQDRKEKRQIAKAQKQQSQAKKSALTIQEVVMMLGAFLVILVLVYFLFYAIISQDSSHTA